MKITFKSSMAVGVCLTLLALTIIFPQTAAAEAKKPPYTIAFANGWIGNFWRAQLVSEIEKAAEFYKGKGLLKELIVANSPNDLSLQINQLNSFINRGVDAIMPDPVSAPALNPIIARAKAKGILTVITNDPAANPDAIAVVGDNYTWQKIQVEWLAKKLNGKGNIVMITGVPGNTADILRQQAVKDVLKKYPDIKILAQAPGYWDEAKAQQAMATFLSTYPEIDGFLIQDVMAEGVIRACEAAGRKPPVMTGDYTAGFIRLWAEKANEIDSIGVPYAPSHAATALGFTIKMLQGRKIDPSKFSPNPMDEKLVNAIMIPVPYVITNNADDMSDRYGKITKYISVKEAAEMVMAYPDTYMIDRRMSDADIDTYFMK